MDHVAELVDQDALDLHPALVFHHVLLGEEHDVAVVLLGQETALPPVVEIQFLALQLALELGDIGGQFVMGDKNAQHLLVADALRDVRPEIRHHLFEKVCRLKVGVVGHLRGSRDQDALRHGGLPEKGRVELVFGGLLLGQGFHLMGCGGAEQGG